MKQFLAALFLGALLVDWMYVRVRLHREEEEHQRGITVAQQVLDVNAKLLTTLTSCRGMVDLYVDVRQRALIDEAFATIGEGMPKYKRIQLAKTVIGEP